MLDQQEVNFLKAVKNKNIPMTSKLQAKIRVKLRKEEYIILEKNPRRWELTDKGKAYLNMI